MRDRRGEQRVIMSGEREREVKVRTRGGRRREETGKEQMTMGIRGLTRKKERACSSIKLSCRGDSITVM